MTRSLEQAELSGIYILTPRGQLGYFDESHRFVVDGDLTSKFADYNHRFIQSYMQTPDNAELRLALTYRPASPRLWRGETLLLTQQALRTLYPARHARTNELTEFQKRHREMSLYRGIELFLDYRSDIAPNCAVYCPVLINRNTLLDRYRDDVGADTAESSAQPVFEVLNLVGLIPLRKRNTPEVLELRHRLYHRVVDKRLRKSLEMRLLDSGRKSRPADASVWQTGAHEPLTLGEPVNRQAVATPAADAGPVNAALLRRFDRFRIVATDTLDRFGQRLEMQTAPPGTVLLRRGESDNWNYYLVSGVVQLEAEDNAKHIIEGGSDPARAALANLQPRRYTVTAVTAVSYLKIDTSAESSLLSSNTPLGFELH
jgi:hypothetical protein